MTTQFVAVPKETTVRETIEVLRGLEEDHPTVHYVYVTEDYGKLVGVLSLRTLVLNDDETQLGDIMYDEILSVTPDEPEDDVVEDIFKYDLPAMPVVDERGALLGIVTTEDAWDAIEDDVSGDKTRASGMKILGIVVSAALLLALYTLVLLQVVGATGFHGFGA